MCKVNLATHTSGDSHMMITWLLTVYINTLTCINIHVCTCIIVYYVHVHTYLMAPDIRGYPNNAFTESCHSLPHKGTVGHWVMATVKRGKNEGHVNVCIVHVYDSNHSNITNWEISILRIFTTCMYMYMYNHWSLAFIKYSPGIMPSCEGNNSNKNTPDSCRQQVE